MLRVLLVVGTLTAFAVTIAIIDHQSNQFAPEKSLPISATKATYAVGMVEGRTENLDLRFQPLGVIGEVLVQPGDHVTRGQVLMRLDDRIERQREALSTASLDVANAELTRLQNGAHAEELKEAEAHVRAKEAALGQASRSLERTRQLLAESAVSPQSAEDQESTVNGLTAELQGAKARLRKLRTCVRPDEIRIAQAKVAAAQAEEQLARIAVEQTMLRAPTDGTVLKVHGDAGEITGPQSERPPIVFADTSEYFVRAYVAESDALRVRPGLAATIRAEETQVSAEGTVESVSPVMRTKALVQHAPEELYDVREREVRIRLGQAENWVLGMRVEVEIELIPDLPQD